jgi:hypothetical protein
LTIGITQAPWAPAVRQRQRRGPSEPSKTDPRRAVKAQFAPIAANRALLTGHGRTSTHARSERVAQLVEHLTFNQVVAGSSPAALTKQNQELTPEIAKLAGLESFACFHRGATAMADEPDSLVLVLLRALDAKIDRIAGDLAVVKTDVIAVKTDVAAHTRTLDILRQDARMVRAAINDIAHTEVTSGEVEALHHDLNRVEKDLAQLAARVEIIEGRGGP